MAKDSVSYLNQNLMPSSVSTESNLFTDPLHSKLIKALSVLKQGKSSPAQWLGILKGFSSKGIKQAEIEDSLVLTYLKSLDPSEKIEKSALIEQIVRHLPLIKRVDLGSPQFKSYVNMMGDYTERLYILSSEGMRADDEIEDLLYQIEELGFNPGPLLKDPLLIDRLEDRMKLIKAGRPTMFDYSGHHYSKSVPKHGKNLMAHSRFTKTEDGLFFIEEIQSDWAQKGRRNNWGPGYPKAPFVTNTEQWSGLVLKDLLQEAAKDPSCQRVAWINSTMRNGFGSTTAEGDDLAVFYNTIVRKCVAKLLGNTTQLLPIDVQTKHRLESVLGFVMTDDVRKELSKSQPMYTRDGVLPYSVSFSSNEDTQRTKERSLVVNECKSMLGDARSIRFVARLYDISQGNEVAGQYLDKGITLSLRAKNLDRAARHEMWHFASENFLLDHERREMRIEFCNGSPLNIRTREVLLSMGLKDAANQCSDYLECEAHAFALWSEGRLDVTDQPKGIFWNIVSAFEKLSNWLSEKIFGVEVTSPTKLFEAMKSGALAARQSEDASEHVADQNADCSPA